MIVQEKGTRTRRKQLKQKVKDKGGQRGRKGKEDHVLLDVNGLSGEEQGEETCTK